MAGEQCRDRKSPWPTLIAAWPRHSPMNRFRPNLVVAGCEPYAEDGWDKIQIGNVVLRVVKL